jgi:hypothetical protein
VKIVEVSLFVTQYFSNIIFDKQDIETLSCVFIPGNDVGNTGKSSRMWTNIPTAF